MVQWQGLQRIQSKKFVCGYCGNSVASDLGYYSAAPNYTDLVTPLRVISRIYICPHCNRPTVFPYQGERIPGELPGISVENLPDNVSALYEEARRCVSVSSHTAAVMLCRTLIMHIAVGKGATEGKSFKFYVNYLHDEHYLPRGSKDWVDHIREQGNEANHEIALKSKEDALNVIEFMGMLAKFIYEYSDRSPDAASDDGDANS